MDMRFAKLTAALIANMPLRKGGGVKVSEFLLDEIGAEVEPDLSVERFDRQAARRSAREDLG